ncbi:MAG: phage terminase small subunit P27 family [Bacteroidota bacterium]
MPKPGRKSKPTNLKVLQGNPGKRKISENEPFPKEIKKVPDPPSRMDYYAKKTWKSLAPKLADLGLLTEIDLTTFGTYCEDYAVLIRAQNKLQEEGLTYISPKGEVKKRPEVNIVRDLSKELRMHAEILGLAPAARSGMEINNIDEGPSVEDILSGKTG